MEAQIVALSDQKVTNVVPVSSAQEGQAFNCASLKLETKVEHESFIPPTGTFGVKTAVNGLVPPQPRSAGNSNFKLFIEQYIK